VDFARGATGLRGVLATPADPSKEARLPWRTGVSSETVDGKSTPGQDIILADLAVALKTTSSGCEYRRWQICSASTPSCRCIDMTDERLPRGTPEKQQEGAQVLRRSDGER